MWQGPPLEHLRVEPVSPVVEEEQSLPPLEDMEEVTSPSFSIWSSSDDECERKLEDDKDAAIETPKDSPHLEWWEEAERKAEEDEILEQQEARLESFATTRKEERTRAAAAQAVRS
jgi:hypothetical protein